VSTLALLARQLGRTLRRHGPAGAARMASAVAIHSLRQLSPARWLARRRNRARQDAFDRARGVDTAGEVPIAALRGIVGRHADDGLRYQGIDPDALLAALAELGLEYPRYTFVDLGCGKGRALLVAAERPFARVMGVEFAPQLYAIAEANLARDRGPRRAGAVTVHLGDAAHHPLPPGPLVLFLFNPFGKRVTRLLLENLERSLAEAPRDVHVLYWNPVLATMWEARGFARAGGSAEHVWLRRLLR
jgi:SAM-dependent methyltransferase